MKTIALITFLFFFQIGYTQIIDSIEYYKTKMDQKFGFRGIKLESTVVQIPNLKLIKKSDDGVVKTYIKTDEKEQIGNAKINYINYIFFKGKLLFIFVKLYSGAENTTNFQRIIESVYGKHHTVDNGAYVWSSNRMVIRIYPAYGYEVHFWTNGKLKDEYFEYEKQKQSQKMNNAINDF